MTALITAAAATLVLVPAARAQTPLDGSAYAFPVPDYVGSLVGINSLDAGGSEPGPGSGREERKRQERAPRPTHRQLAALRFEPVPEVTHAVYQRVLDQAGPGADPAVVTARLDAAKGSFRQVLRQVGWSPHDLGDVAAFCFVQGYATWHERQTIPEQGLRAVRHAPRHRRALRATRHGSISPWRIAQRVGSPKRYSGASSRRAPYQ